MIFEDEHLLVVNKPAGWNTHAPAPYVGEGIFDWLRHREPRWASLAIIHRLDKETSGVLIFGKTPLANRSLTRQFTEHRITKRYLLLTDRSFQHESWTVRNKLTRVGSRYASVPENRDGAVAETHFTVISRSNGRTLISAQPLTGRTHQIRVHAAESGLPVLGDVLYGGSAFTRVCLHAASIELEHPDSGETRKFTVPAAFKIDARSALRAAFIDHKHTNAFRLVHGASDGWPSWQVDRFGDFLLSQSEAALDLQRRTELERLQHLCGAHGVYHKCLSRHVGRTSLKAACPQRVMGDAAPDRFSIWENGLRFELSFREGYSVGLFLDQRDNRHHLLRGYVAPGFPALALGRGGLRSEILNTFSYTCGFSVCAARGGARVTSLDLSRKYLDWGRRNFELNGLDPSGHDFIFGDAFDWMKRFHKRRRWFDLVILDPPTFSKSRQSGIFRAEKDFGRLVKAAVRLLRPEGVLFASTNAAHWAPDGYLATVRDAVRSLGRDIVKEHYQPQPPDFPIARDEPSHLKTAWFIIG